MGFCSQCGERGSLVEVVANSGERRDLVAITEVGEERTVRHPVHIGEIDRVLGGGFVPGAAVLLGGEPGVGKSTLLLQIAAAIAAESGRVLVASAEESAGQIALRGRRIGAAVDGIDLLAESSLENILATADAISPSLLVIDSIQTVTTSKVDGIAGSVGQVRASGAEAVAFAKRTGIPVVLVGHVTKDGAIAGPKVLEHLVDVVLYLEGDDAAGLRVLRSLKNRYGSINQIGLFEMGDRGMIPVVDPAKVLLADRRSGSAGTVLAVTLEGRRPIVLEVQALVSKSVTPQPRRSVKGIDAARVHQLLAVLENHSGLNFADRDVYVNVVGGIKLKEPAADLPVALALASSRAGVPLDEVVAWGELGLTGELRPVSQAGRRREEALRLGMNVVIAPADAMRTIGDALVAAGMSPVRRKGAGRDE
jgi:DNA repair protein RadA/Sms